MTKRITLAAVAALATFAAFYLFGSFVAVSFSIAEWDGSLRLFVAIIGGFYTAVAAIIAWKDHP